ncbi:MAG: rhamnulokinase family protein [Phycisphaerae bacterium]
MPTRHVAIDLGAESGRVMLGTLDGGRLVLEEIHRFESTQVRVFGHTHWDVLGMWGQIQKGLVAAAGRGRIDSVSCDSWGVDYVLLRGELSAGLHQPYIYRDARTDNVYAEVMTDQNAAFIFEQTGIQFMSINTLFQLLADAAADPGRHVAAERFLLIGDYFNYLLSGIAAAEASLASTTQCFDPRTMTWSDELIARFKLERDLFPPVVAGGTVLGPVHPTLHDVLPLPEAKVIATASHDTACAVAACPASAPAEPDTDWAFLSSGSWSLLGMQTPEPVIHDKAREYNFTNEVAYGGQIRLLKNISGLFILQELRKEIAPDVSYAELAQQAAEAEPLRTLIRPDDAPFARPGDMAAKIAGYCRRTNQPVPRTPGEYTRCVYESLALLYGVTLKRLAELTGRTPGVLHVVGGGSKSELLNQLAADATGISVVAGPAEATAVGNCLIQAIACGQLASLEELREVVRNSFDVKRYEPKPDSRLREAARRFEALPLT